MQINWGFINFAVIKLLAQPVQKTFCMTYQSNILKIMNSIRCIVSVFAILLTSVFSIKAQSDQKELAVALMNNCVNTLTNIINNKSMLVLEHESDQILNNLTVKQIVGFPEISEFRVDLIDAIDNLSITEEEREILRKVNSVKQDNLKWRALSGALNNTMLLTGGGSNAYQLGFQALLTAARTGIEYKASKNDLQIEEMQAMWDLRKDDLKDFSKLRKEALDIIFRLYQKHNLKESDRLTEQTSQQFQKIITEPDAKKMVRLLIDNAGKFGHMADYYYYLGMGYLDSGNINKANECFDRYEELYDKAPIYRINEKGGMISLARLTHNKNLTIPETEKLVANVLKNLPNNAMANIQCAVITDRVLKKPANGLSILRSALDNVSTDDKTAVIMTASLLAPKVNSNTAIYKDFISAYVNQKSYDIDAAINMWIAKKDNVFLKLKSIFTISDLATHPWVVGDAEVSDKMIISCPSKYTVNISQVQMFVEKHTESEVYLYPYILSEKNALTIDQINKIDCFKQNPNLKYLYMDACGKDKYMIKFGIDYNAIQQNTYHKQEDFSLSDKDRKKIIKFLKENAPERTRTQIVATKSDNKLIKVEKNGVTFNLPEQFKSKLGQLKNLAAQHGRTYVKFAFNDVRKIEICYIFDATKECLNPCYIEYQGKKHFANEAYMKEFGLTQTPKTTTTQKAGASTKKTSAPVKKSATPKTPAKTNAKKEADKKEKSWWNKLTGDDEKSDKKEPTKKSDAKDSKKTPAKKETKKEAEKEKSWWKVWD